MRVFVVELSCWVQERSSEASTPKDKTLLTLSTIISLMKTVLLVLGFTFLKSMINFLVLRVFRAGYFFCIIQSDYHSPSSYSLLPLILPTTGVLSANLRMQLVLCLVRQSWI